MLLFFGNLINQFFGRTAHAVMSAAETKLRRATVGRVQGSAGAAEARMRQNALRSVSNIGSSRNNNNQ